LNKRVFRKKKIRRELCIQRRLPEGDIRDRWTIEGIDRLKRFSADVATKVPGDKGVFFDKRGAWGVVETSYIHRTRNWMDVSTRGRKGTERARNPKLGGISHHYAGKSVASGQGRTSLSESALEITGVTNEGGKKPKRGHVCLWERREKKREKHDGLRRREPIRGAGGVKTKL